MVPYDVPVVSTCVWGWVKLTMKKSPGTKWGPVYDSYVGEHNSNVTMVYGLWYANNYSYRGESKPTYITFGGPTLYVVLGTIWVGFQLISI